MTRDIDISDDATVPVGRFAPSPSGRMHLGNVFTALLSWLSVRSRGGRWILRIEDLDPQRSRLEHARLIEDDLQWLGLDRDEGGIDGTGPSAPYLQSLRHGHYEKALCDLEATGLTYPCRCTRADIMATQAPHASDGRVVYAGTCRPEGFPAVRPKADSRPAATRIMVPNRDICFTDIVAGPQAVNLAELCGDFVLRRADGAWAYQLAVVVDDALMGVTEVVRGCDLLDSAARQIYLFDLLRFKAPAFAHVPLLCNQTGQRLSKRDASLDMGSLRRRYSPEELVGYLGHLAGLLPQPEPVTPAALAEIFDWSKVRRSQEIRI